MDEGRGRVRDGGCEHERRWFLSAGLASRIVNRSRSRSRNDGLSSFLVCAVANNYNNYSIDIVEVADRVAEVEAEAEAGVEAEVEAETGGKTINYKVVQCSGVDWRSIVQRCPDKQVKEGRLGTIRR